MKLCRFDHDRLALVDGDVLREVTPALSGLPALRWPLPPGDPLLTHLGRLRPVLESMAASAATLPLAGRLLCSPVASAGKVVAVRRNYAVAAAASADFFLKAASSVTGPGSGVILPPVGRPCSAEIECAAIIGLAGRAVAERDALRHVAGYCIALDLGVDGDEDRGMRKSAETFCVLGPWLTTADEVDPAAGLGMELRVNGRSVRQGRTDSMLRSVAQLVAAASCRVRLDPGDVLLTGSPAGGGVGIGAGDLLECRIDGLGAMEVAVTAAV